MTRLHVTLPMVVLLLLAGCCDNGETSPAGASDPAGQMKGIKVIDGAELLASRTGKSIVVGPVALPLAECARITILPSKDLTGKDLETLFAKSIGTTGLELESTEDTITIGYDYSRHFPAGCEDAVPVRGTTGARVLSSDRPSPRRSLKDRLDPRLNRLSDGDAGPSPVRSSSRRADEDYSSLITKVSDYDYRVPRSVRDRALGEDGLNQHMRRVRIIPNYKDGQQTGFKLFAIRPGSLLQAMGLRNGDTVTGINGKTVNTPELALEALVAIKKAHKVSIQITRRGMPQEINYRFTRG